jgi:hypothetical protein
VSLVVKGLYGRIIKLEPLPGYGVEITAWISLEPGLSMPLPSTAVAM